MKTDAVGGLAGEVKPPRNEPYPSPGGVCWRWSVDTTKKLDGSSRASKIERPLPVRTAPPASMFSASGETIPLVSETKPRKRECDGT